MSAARDGPQKQQPSHAQGAGEDPACRQLRSELEQARKQIALLKQANQCLRRKSSPAVETISRSNLAATPSPLGTGDADVIQRLKDLQRQVDLLQRQKIDLEIMLEQEQERIVNHLARQMDQQCVIPTPVTTIAASQSPVRSSPKWKPTHSPASSISSEFGVGPLSIGGGPSAGLTESLKAEINALRLRLSESEKDLVSTYSQCQIYRKELIQLRQKLGISVADLTRDEYIPNVGYGGYVSGIDCASARAHRQQRRSMSVSTPTRRPALSRSNSISSRYSIASGSSPHHLSYHYYYHQPPGGGSSNNSGMLSATASSFPVSSESQLGLAGNCGYAPAASSTSSISSISSSISSSSTNINIGNSSTGASIQSVAKPTPRSERPSRARSLLLTPRRSLEGEYRSYH